MPPPARSRAGLAFSAWAARGEFRLQVCGDCGTTSYPPRDVCPNCWSSRLEWQPAAPTGRLLADTVLHTSTNVYFRERMPWRVGTVEHESGVALLAHIHSDVPTPAQGGQPVRLTVRTDKSGQGVIVALPVEDTPHMNDEKQLRELSASVRHRRVLITDVRTDFGQALALKVREAGASRVFAGVAEPWKPFPGRDALATADHIEQVSLDVTQGDSVLELAGAIGGKTDILINTASHVRPGSTVGRNGLTAAKDEMETNYFGLLRLLQYFGPAMQGRAADGDNNAVCWVNLLSIYALSNWPAYATTSASHAAALSLAQGARADFQPSGIKVLNVFHGPLESEWYQPVSPPKVTPAKLARVVVDALEAGLEEKVVGDIAQDVMARWQENPAVLERELTQDGGAL